jgi:D-glycero-D-manno-heptose 1,7-bisphosphate phosphatase
MRPFVILDRDGVINEDSPDYIKRPAEWLPIPGALEGIALLTLHDVDIFIATNQAGVARGKLTLESLHAIHEKLRVAVETSGGIIRDIHFCPHHPNENCRCRKPAPGLLMDICDRYQLDPKAGYYVGDSLKDLRAAEAAGCQAVLVLTGNGEETHRLRPRQRLVFDDLLKFARFLTEKL